MVSPDKATYFKTLARSRKLNFKTYIEDVQDLLNNENRVDIRETFDLDEPDQRSFWTKYHTLEEIYDWLDSVAEAYPKNAEVVIGGQSYENREIKGLKLKFGTGEKPVVFIEGGIHAREWISPATATYLINEFLSSDDPEVRQLAEDYEWYVFPSVNPDGYVYTHKTVRICFKLSKNSIFFMIFKKNWTFSQTVQFKDQNILNQYFYPPF